jgi:aconitate hydratase
VATKADGQRTSFDVICRVDSAIEVDYVAHGGILPYVLRGVMSQTV